MSRFYGSLESGKYPRSKNPRTLSGSGVLESHVRGFHTGVRVIADGDPDGPDRFSVYLTTGSNGDRGQDCLVGVFDFSGIPETQKEKESHSDRSETD